MRLEVMRSFFFNGRDHYFISLRARRIQHQERELAVAGDESEFPGWGHAADSLIEFCLSIAQDRRPDAAKGTRSQKNISKSKGITTGYRSQCRGSALPRGKGGSRIDPAASGCGAPFRENF